MARTTATREDTSSATPIIKTTITEVAIAEAEAEEVETMETETILRELTARMVVNHKFYPLLIFLFSIPRILRIIRQLKIEKISLVT